MDAEVNRGYPPLYAVSFLLLMLALAGIVALIGSDLHHRYAFSAEHQRLDAWPLLMIGFSTIVLHGATHQSPSDRRKGILLGIAFLLWGGEQLLPQSQLVTLMDEGAVSIFTIDVGVIIWSYLNRPETASAP